MGRSPWTAGRRLRRPVAAVESLDSSNERASPGGSGPEGTPARGLPRIAASGKPSVG